MVALAGDGLDLDELVRLGVLEAAVLGDLFLTYFWVYRGGVNLDASIIDDDGKVTNRLRQFANMLLSKWPIQSSRNHLLPKFRMFY